MLEITATDSLLFCPAQGTVSIDLASCSRLSTQRIKFYAQTGSCGRALVMTKTT